MRSRTIAWILGGLAIAGCADRLLPGGDGDAGGSGESDTGLEPEPTASATSTSTTTGPVSTSADDGLKLDIGGVFDVWVPPPGPPPFSCDDPPPLVNASCGVSEFDTGMILVTCLEGAPDPCPAVDSFEVEAAQQECVGDCWALLDRCGPGQPGSLHACCYWALYESTCGP